MLCDCECEMERQADRLWLSETVESIKYVKNEGRAWGSLCQCLFFDKTVKEWVCEMMQIYRHTCICMCGLVQDAYAGKPWGQSTPVKTALENICAHAPAMQLHFFTRAPSHLATEITDADPPVTPNEYAIKPS